MLIIDGDDIEFDEDVVLRQGVPFTGMIRAYHPNGAIREDTPYCDGFKEGICKEWHDNGQLSCEWHAVRGVIHGKKYEWHANGQIRSIASHSHGVDFSCDEWDETGLLIIHREIDKQSSLYKYAISREG
jgi:antitoxin component YwqK of YwqJK toxin-antitoxin module